MPTRIYLVTWSAFVEAPSAKEAAKEAVRTMQNRKSENTTLTITNTQTQVSREIDCKKIFRRGGS